MTHSSIDQLQVLIDSLDDISLNAGSRIEVLQRIRRAAASLYLNESKNPASNSDQIDVMVLAAIETALLPFEQESPAHSNTDTIPAAEYSQP